MPFQTPPIPLGDDVVYPNRKLTKAWVDWWGPFLLDVDAAPARVGTAAEITQGAIIAATPIGAGLAPGLYRVSYFAHITQAASTSSSLTVTVRGTHNAQNYSMAGVAITGNTTGTAYSESFLVQIDADAAVTWETAYVSVGGTPMQYAISVVIEQVAA